MNAHQSHPLLNQPPFLVRNFEIDAAAFAFGASDEVDEICGQLTEASGLFGSILEQLSKIK